MEIVVIDNKIIDLDNSLINEDAPLLKGVNSIKGAVAIDDSGKLLPLISEFLSYRLRNHQISVETAKTYGKNLIYFLAYLKKRTEFRSMEGDEPFLTVKKHFIEKYLSSLRELDNLSSITIRNRDATLSAFISGFLCNQSNAGEVCRLDNPYKNGLLSPSPKSNLIESCSFDDLVSLMLCTESERERLVLQFIFDSGVRRSEVPRVSVQDINDALNFDKQEFVVSNKHESVRPSYSPLCIFGSKGKGDNYKKRYTLISKSTLNRIKKYHSSPLFKKYARKFSGPSCTPAFFNAHGTAFNSSSISKLLERLSIRARKKHQINSNISPHKLRHGFAYSILQSNDIGVDYLDRLVFIQKTLGHSNLQTTEIYSGIPQDLYNSMVEENGVIKTRAKKMEYLLERTQIRIKINDSK